MSTWSYTHAGKRDEVISFVQAMTADKARTAALPQPPTMMKEWTIAEQKAAMDSHSRALLADDEIWQQAAAVFERTKVFVLAQLALYAPDADVGVLVRLHLSPMGPPASEELYVSISEHLG